MSSTFDTVQRALSRVRDRGGLSEHYREIIVDVQQVIDEWHEENHRLNDAINRGARVLGTTDLLRITMEESDPERRRQRQAEYYSGNGTMVEARYPRCGRLFFLEPEESEGALCCICKRDVEYEARYGPGWRQVVRRRGS